jgi:hypothetical protein
MGVVICTKDIRNAYRIYLENQKDRYHVGDTGINGRATL